GNDLAGVTGSEFPGRAARRGACISIAGARIAARTSAALPAEAGPLTSETCGQRASAAKPSCVRAYLPRSIRTNQPYTLPRSILGAFGTVALSSDVCRGP